MARRETPEINAGSMADIAFLLLIFFLVTTTMDTDKGIAITLPPYTQDSEVVPSIDRNVLEILVNSRDALLVEGELISITELTKVTREFLTNNGVNPNLSVSPQVAIVSLKNDRSTSYDIYIKVQNELKRAYNELRNEEAQRRYGKDFEDLANKYQKVIGDVYPIKLSEAEMENIEGAN